MIESKTGHNSGNNLKKVIIDSRENYLISLFNGKKDKVVEIEVKKLDVGDVIISNECAIERKMGIDYVQSIIDKRLFSQLFRLKEVYENPILIVEGLNETVFDIVNVNLSSIYGALAYILKKLRINIIYTLNLEHTAILIERLALMNNNTSFGNPLIARTAPKKLNKKERQIYIIEGLIDCGHKKAKLLIDHFGTPFDAIMAMKDTKILSTKTGNAKGISGPLKELKGFGHKFLEKNKEILFKLIN